jgi:hypothetical protein
VGGRVNAAGGSPCSLLRSRVAGASSGSLARLEGPAHQAHNPLDNESPAIELSAALGTLSLVGLTSPSSVFAADSGAAAPGGTVGKACAQDVKTLCPDVKAGDGRIKACLKDKRAKLSDGCKAAM